MVCGSLIPVLLSSLLVIFFLFTLYNVPIVLAGAHSLLRSRKRRRAVSKGSGSVDCDGGRLPFVSVLVPVKNEEKVVGRLLDALLRVDYPANRLEVIVVDDASTDRTGEVCFEYASKHPNVKVLQKKESSTKAAALNFGLKSAVGDVIATFDGDSVPEVESFRRAVKYFDDSCVAGVQGRICSINAGQNVLTRFISYEGSVQYEVYVGGKDSLNLFVSLAGTCQFIRKADLEALGGWNEDSLAEDTELSARLIEQDKVIRYASEVRTFEESPSTIKSLLTQRARWFRGIIEVGLKFGRLLKRPSFRRFDAEMTFLGPFIIMLSLINYFAPFWAFSLSPVLAWVVIANLVGLFTLTILGLVGFALTCLEKPLRWRNVLWLPFIYAYWVLQSFIALYSLFEILLRRKRRWRKTEHFGSDTVAPEKRLTVDLPP